VFLGDHLKPQERVLGGRMAKTDNQKLERKNGEVTVPSFWVTANEKVYITAIGCEIGFGGTRGLRAAET
jgi:hypothetical protein